VCVCPDCCVLLPPSCMAARKRHTSSEGIQRQSLRVTGVESNPIVRVCVGVLSIGLMRTCKVKSNDRAYKFTETSARSEVTFYPSSARLPRAVKAISEGTKVELQCLHSLQEIETRNQWGSSTGVSSDVSTTRGGQDSR
jgi:hypothetical protein